MLYINSNTKLEIAQAYCDLGLQIFPVHTNESGKCSCGNEKCNYVAKHPLTKNGVKDATNDPAKLKRYFSGNYESANIGLATGSTSGIVVIDIDSSGLSTQLEDAHTPFPKTWKSKTGNGKHFFFRLPENVTIRNSQKKIDPVIDVRGEGGYVILPPSQHANGKRYEWLNDPSETELADLPAWLLPLLTGPEPQTQTLTVKAGIDEAEKAKRYLAKTPPAISGENGHNHTFATVCRLLELFPALNDDELLDVLNDWNNRCDPPWTVKELRHKIDSARERVDVDEDDEDNMDDIELVYAEPEDEDEIEDEDEDEESEEWPVLNDDALYGLAGQIVRRIEPQTEADPVALLVTLLNAFGGIVGRSPHTVIEKTPHHVNTFFAIVGQSSRARKGTSLGHIVNLFSDNDELSDMRIDGLSTGEGLIAHLQERPHTWIVESEFSQPLRVMKRDGNTLSPILRNLWDRDTVSVTTRNNPLKATGCHVSILGHITHEELHKSLDNVDVFNGFGNRFLWCLSRRSKSLPLGGDAIELDDLRKRLKDITQQSQMIGKMEFSAEAKAVYTSRYDALGEGRRGLWDAVTSRAEAQVIRLSMLYALLDGVATINVDHLKAALAVWDYADDSARLIFNLADTEGDTLERKILDVLEDYPGITKTEIRDMISHKLKAKELNRSLKWLKQKRKIVRESKIKNGRRYDVWYLAGQEGRRALGQEDNPNALTPQRPVQTETLPELLDWLNSNESKFFRRDDGIIWVTNEERLTPSLKATIEQNQEALADIVDDNKNDNKHGSKPLTEDEFYDNLDSSDQTFVDDLAEL
ncbi:hypothetical protein Pan153_41550 [Gimesia panareensis]|uniref:DNA primase/polymerase bifunctional N-terminal domain-containing protein n=1 Tax=Gimesia panareensis TaxID=2527978 RepID=A0A518FT19_9PLAN|nr:bifunctional DNA primase/polymerase [Gimesia panareensis]QDV19489.1 hypothetical protein Pan153_41550 [Gimesia panareensis]